MKGWLVVAFLALEGLVAWGLGAREHPVTPPDWERLPKRLGAWVELREDPMIGEIRRIAKADAVLSRYYRHEKTGAVAQVLVAWYASQREGERQPHQPTICLAGAGWREERGGDIQAGGARARRLTVSRGGARSKLVYWYQTAERADGREWAMKGWLAWDGLRLGRTDGALVRVAGSGGGEEELAGLVYERVRALWPVLSHLK